MTLAGGQPYSLRPAEGRRRAGPPRTAGAARRDRRRYAHHRRGPLRDSRRHRQRAGTPAGRVQPRAAGVRRARGLREDRPADLWQPGVPSAAGQGAGCDARRAGHVAAQRLLERVRAGPLLQGHRRRHRRELRARRELSEPRRPGDRHPRRHRRVERDAGLRPAEDPQHRGAEVRGRAVVAAARDLPGAGDGARPGGQRAGRAARGRRPSPRFRRRWRPRPRPA